jgi:parallel beta helix pectate lyase-like protein
MEKRQNSIRVAIILGLLSPAVAIAAQRTFVSAGSGSDANLCTRQLPCRNFVAAMAQTDSEGEVVVLDSGGYGAVTISQSVTLVAVGVHAAITAFSGNAITVTASPSDVVIIRGLYLSGLGGSSGIDFQTGQTLHVENCVASGFNDVGINVSAGAGVYVKDTISRQNFAGFFLSSGSSIRASLDSIRVEENDVGVQASSNSLVTVTRGTAAGNGLGFHAATLTGVINLESCTATLNATGVRASGTARVANSMITGNTNGVSTAAGGTTISFGNNRLDGNTTDGTFTTTLAQK